jgi:hypothetical protein
VDCAVIAGECASICTASAAAQCAQMVLWCEYLQCCCNDDLHWQHRFAPHQARSASGCAREASSGAVPVTLRPIRARAAAVPCECRARRGGCVG